MILKSWSTYTLIENGNFYSLFQKVPKPAVMTLLKRTDFENMSTSYIHELRDSRLWWNVYEKVMLLCACARFFVFKITTLNTVVEVDIHKAA